MSVVRKPQMSLLAVIMYVFTLGVYSFHSVPAKLQI